MLPYLKRCHASIRDQGVSFEHIVVDGGSNDGSIDWIVNNNDIVSVVGKDSGMYDALNKGLEIARGEIICHLNSDEQYLPNTLKRIGSLFEIHSDISLLYGNRLMVDTNGAFLREKKALNYNKNFILFTHLYISTCSSFYRRIILDSGLRYNPELIACGDAEFFIDIHDKGFKSKYFNEAFGIFTKLKSNLGRSKRAKIERVHWEKSHIKSNIIYKMYYLCLVTLVKTLSGYYSKSTLTKFNIYYNTLKRTEVRI